MVPGGNLHETGIGENVWSCEYYLQKWKMTSMINGFF